MVLGGNTTLRLYSCSFHHEEPGSSLGNPTQVCHMPIGHVPIIRAVLAEGRELFVTGQSKGQQDWEVDLRQCGCERSALAPGRTGKASAAGFRRTEGLLLIPREEPEQA